MCNDFSEIPNPVKPHSSVVGFESLFQEITDILFFCLEQLSVQYLDILPPFLLGIILMHSYNRQLLYINIIKGKIICGSDMIVGLSDFFTEFKISAENPLIVTVTVSYPMVHIVH